MEYGLGLASRFVVDATGVLLFELGTNRCRLVRRKGMGIWGASASCREPCEGAGLMLPLSVVSAACDVRDGVRARPCGDSVDGPGVIEGSLDSSSRSFEPPRRGVEAWRF
jgi:hypothetical protein